MNVLFITDVINNNSFNDSDIVFFFFYFKIEWKFSLYWLCKKSILKLKKKKK